MHWIRMSYPYSLADLKYAQRQANFLMSVVIFLKANTKQDSFTLVQCRSYTQEFKPVVPLFNPVRGKSTL